MREKATDDGLLTLHWNYMIVIEKDTHQIYLTVESITGTKPRTFIGFTRIMLSISIKNYLIS